MLASGRQRTVGVLKARSQAGSGGPCTRAAVPCLGRGPACQPVPISRTPSAVPVHHLVLACTRCTKWRMGLAAVLAGTCRHPLSCCGNLVPLASFAHKPKSALVLGRPACHTLQGFVLQGSAHEQRERHGGENSRYAGMYSVIKRVRRCSVALRGLPSSAGTTANRVVGRWAKHGALARPLGQGRGRPCGTQLHLVPHSRRRRQHARYDTPVP